MIRTPVSPVTSFVTSFALLSSSLVLAQAPPAPTPPPSGDAQISGPRPPRVQTRGIQEFRTSDGGPGGMARFRIGPPGMWWKNPDLVQKLSLTADQQKRMDDIFQQSRLQLIDLKANVEKQEVMLEPMLDANPPDTNKVLAQIDRVAQARAELEKANAKMLLGIRGVLTADQWTKLQADRRENGPRMMMRFHGGPMGPDGPNSMLGLPALPDPDDMNPAVIGMAIVTQPPTE